ncbi:hypothetical protein EYR41_011085 [Orbilia oligospora]|uniref:FAD dependent oxidoreductase domain-containing protein n=1 Tax=Orbilia oligospora TaxID=2813651 RepID=A0A7C8KYW6_ORBOL|nr:hypothetical protein TWF751_003495 [Orbilia oligospora]TGJ63144.1 hypothetical protein EYR41_011085 [Orbilia oligospora]
MGILLSKLRRLRIAISVLLEQKAVLDNAVTRLHKSPGLPLPNPTKSFWLLPESPLLSNIQSPKLPESADIIVIGSGITSTGFLRELYRLNPDLNVVLLEARGPCTGATGRNGGHIKEGPYEEYPRLKSIYGNETAARILRFRLRHLEELKAVAKEEGEDCLRESEVREVTGTDVFFDHEVMNEGVSKFQEWKRENPEMGREWGFWDQETTRKRLNIPTATGAIYGPAGALWPYRLCTSVLARLVSSHPNLKIESYTPVEDISFDSSTSTYTVSTPRGKITSKTVIHTTNGWASHLLPGLRGKVFAFQGQMSAQEAPEGLPGMGEQYSWSFIHKKGFDYLTQRASTSVTHPDGTATQIAGEMMFGGAWASTENMGMDVCGLADDTKLNYLAAAHLSGLLPYVFGSGDDSNGTRSWNGVKVKNMWTGILGMSADGLPWVGRVPTKVSTRNQPKKGKTEKGVEMGEWCAVGFSGEGMVNCWGSATALARMVLGEEVNVNVRNNEARIRALKGEEGVKGWKDEKLEEWFPKEFVIEDSRIAKANPLDLVGALMGF